MTGKGFSLSTTTKPEGRSLFAWLVVLAGLLLFLASFFVLPPALVPTSDFPAAPNIKAAVRSANDERLQRENDVRGTAVQALGGLVLVLGLVVTYRTFRLTRDGQITDRFSEAIEQLGSDELPTCLGAIYSLERIARSSRYDHGIVMETFMGFLRERSPVSGASTSIPPARDAQAIITVLGRRRHDFDAEDFRLQLQSLNLHGLSFGGGDFRAAQFRGSDLTRATFVDTQLQEALFSSALLLGANFDDAQCKGARFDGAHLEGAEVARAKSFVSTNAHCGPGIGPHVAPAPPARPAPPGPAA